MAKTAAEMVELIDEAIEAHVNGNAVFKASHAGSSLENASLEELHKLREMYAKQTKSVAGAGQIQMTRLTYGKVTDG